MRYADLLQVADTVDGPGPLRCRQQDAGQNGNDGDDDELIMLVAVKIRDQAYPPQLAPCLEYIGANISRKLSLDSICAACNIGKTELKALFRQYLQTTPGRYVINLRLDNALKMLQNGSSPIKQIAYACGYENPLYFSNAFKARFGASPRKFLKTSAN